MALASISQRVNNLISVADDNTASSADKYLKQLEEGKLGYIFESKLFDSLQTNPMNSAGGSISDLIELQQYLKASMYNEIGLNANYNMKRERLNSAEVEMNSDNLYPLVDNMLEHRRIALEQINEKYGSEISVEFNSSWDYRINQGEDIDDEYLEQADNQGNGEDMDFSQLLDNPTETEGNGEDNSEDAVEGTTEDTQGNEEDEERPQEETEEY